MIKRTCALTPCLTETCVELMTAGQTTNSAGGTSTLLGRKPCCRCWINSFFHREINNIGKYFVINSPHHWSRVNLIKHHPRDSLPTPISPPMAAYQVDEVIMTLEDISCAVAATSIVKDMEQKASLRDSVKTIFLSLMEQSMSLTVASPQNIFISPML